VIAADTASATVRVAYTLAELLGGEADALAWTTFADGDAASTLPPDLSRDNQEMLLEELEDAGASCDGQIDRFRTAEIARVLQLAPLMRAAEDARRPAPSSRLVCTMPPEALLPAEMRYIQRSLAMLVTDTLRAPGNRVLLAAPYWSGPGTAQLFGPLTLAIAIGVPITLAGARRIDVPHHTAMTVFARELREAGARVRVLNFNPPREKSLFHAKIVAGKRGYLGTGNLSSAASRTTSRSACRLTKRTLTAFGGSSKGSSRPSCSSPRRGPSCLTSRVSGGTTACGSSALRATGRCWVSA
jgi:hypothetical protein